MLSAFVIAQIVFDVAVVALAAVYLLTRPAPRALAVPEPPEWYAQFLKLAQDLMAATEPVLDRLEAREPAPPPSPPVHRYDAARTLLRSGARPEEVAGQAGLQPGEMRLLAKIVAAESRRRSG
jgi:hypothetical protein